MDKNTIIGLVLIVLIIVGFSIMNRPTEEQLERQRRYNDSIAWVRKAELEKQEAIRTAKMLAEQQSEAVADSAAARQQLQDVYGVFAGSVMGTDTLYVLENDLLRVRISSKGGRIYSAELKNYRTHDSLPLFLFDGDESQFGFTLVTNNNRVLNTADMYFVPTDGQIVRDNEGNQQLTMRLKTSGEAYMDFVYTLPANDYMLKMDVRSHAMEQVLPLGTNFLEMQWNAKVRQQEKGRKFEERYATLQYKFMDDEIENLSESKDDKKDIPSRLKWIAFKDQFFSSVIIADDAFTSTVVESAMMTEKSGYIKSYKSSMSVEYDPTGNQPTGFRFYLGPNHYKTLLSYDKGVDRDERLRLNELIPLGWKIVAWINRIGVIPMFNLFSRWFSNFGIIILLMTIVIKIVIFPFTYKSYISSAKMRVLKPEIDEINARIPAEKIQERQQATMALYRKVGVSPMSGCLPLLFHVLVLPDFHRIAPAKFSVGQRFVHIRCDYQLGCVHSDYHTVFRQPHKPVLPAHDCDEYHLFENQHGLAARRKRTDAVHEMDDVLDAYHVHVHFQQLCSRIELLLFHLVVDYYHTDLYFPLDNRRKEAVGETSCQTCQKRTQPEKIGFHGTSGKNAT